MRTLALDTSSRTLVIGLDNNGDAVGIEVPDFDHATNLMPKLASFLTDLACSINDIDRLAFLHGPGSFTGLRIGLASIKGLAFSLDKPITCLRAFDVLAHEYSEQESLLCLIHSRKNKCFAAGYHKGQKTFADAEISYEELADVAKAYKAAVGPVLGAVQEVKDIIVAAGLQTICEHGQAITNGATLARFAGTHGSVETASNAIPYYIANDVAKKKEMHK